MARPVLSTLAFAGAAFVACQVYEPSLLTGGAGSAGRGAGSGAGAGVGGVAAGGNGVGGSALPGGTTSGGTASGATGGGGTSGFEAGAGGEGDEPAGGMGAGGALGGTGGSTGAGGATGGGAGTGGGSAGKGGGSAGSTGAAGKGGGAGTASAGTAGTATGGAGASAGGAGAGGAGGAGAPGGGSGGVPTVELMGTATASTSENGGASNKIHPAAYGNDEDPLTRWCASSGATGQYWTVDLGAVHEVVRFEVTWEYPSQAAGLPYLYRLDVSTDGTTFTTSVDKTTNMEVTSTQSVSFPPGTMARHVRIVVTGLPNAQTWASFFEASVYGI